MAEQRTWPTGGISQAEAAEGLRRLHELLHEANSDFRTYKWEPEPEPVIEVGTPIYGETTEGEPITWYVTEVAEDGTIRVGSDKPVSG